jgi:hypothetical protein
VKNIEASTQIEEKMVRKTHPTFSFLKGARFSFKWFFRIRNQAAADILSIEKARKR